MDYKFPHQHRWGTVFFIDSFSDADGCDIIFLQLREREKESNHKSVDDNNQQAKSRSVWVVSEEVDMLKGGSVRS